jgi:hypothetical protein
MSVQQQSDLLLEGAETKLQEGHDSTSGFCAGERRQPTATRRSAPVPPTFPRLVVTPTRNAQKENAHEAFSATPASADFGCWRSRLETSWNRGDKGGGVCPEAWRCELKRMAVSGGGIEGELGGCSEQEKGKVSNSSRVERRLRGEGQVSGGVHRSERGTPTKNCNFHELERS